MTRLRLSCGSCDLVQVPIDTAVADPEAETLTVNCPSCGKTITVRQSREALLTLICAGAQLVLTDLEVDVFAAELEDCDDLVAVLEQEEAA